MLVIILKTMTYIKKKKIEKQNIFFKGFAFITNCLFLSTAAEVQFTVYEVQQKN